jgi:ribosome-binding protein aMBF1 (putative translation factor)
MNLNTIQALGGQRFVLLPIEVYTQLEPQISAFMRQSKPATRSRRVAIKTPFKPKTTSADYAPFVLDEYVSNPVALARIKAGLTQSELAKRLGVSQPYIAKLEAQGRVSAQKLSCVLAVV